MGPFKEIAGRIPASLALAAGLFALLMSATACTTTSTPTSTPPQPQTRLEEALTWVPLEYADKIIEFADYATSRKLTGLEDVRGFEDYLQLDEDQRDRIYEGLRTNPPNIIVGPFLHDELGLDIFALDLGIWHSSGIHHAPTFTLMEGGQDIRDISNKLVDLGFEETRNSFNRTALVDDQVLATPATSILEDLIDVQKGGLSQPARKLTSSSPGPGRR